MELLEDTLPVELDAFLDRPLFCFLATLSAGGAPRISPLWFLWEDGSVWIIADRERTYAMRVERTPEAALAVVDFDARSGLVQHVGMRGAATLEPFDADRADRLLRRYLGERREAWDEGFRGLGPDRWGVIRFDPETVVARDQSFTPSPGASSAGDG